MNYGFNSNSENWKEEKKNELFCELKKLTDKIYSKLPVKKRITAPYIEINGLYDGVRIRRITHLEDKTCNSLIEQAEKIYEKIMIDQ